MTEKLYYTIRPSFILDQNMDCSDFGHYKFNIIFASEVEFTPHLYTTLNRLKNQYIISICSSLLRERRSLQQILPKVYLLLSLNRSLIGRKVLPVFLETQNHNSPANLETLQKYLDQQGLKDIKLPIFDLSVNEIQTKENCSFSVLKEDRADFQNLYSADRKYSTIRIIASGNENIDFPLIKKVEEQFITYERNVGPGKDILPCYTDQEELEREVELWKERTLLYKDFLSLSKSVQEKEYYDLNKWYLREYEILPLWYKQFGHIIKVIMGKRSFRSLFSDKVKKYKE
ncbi:MAG: hypothetical protein ACSLE0_00920 [Chitinophagaceae bacterium]